MNSQIKGSQCWIKAASQTIICPVPNSMHLSEHFLYSQNDHSEAMELPIGFYTFIINYIFRHKERKKPRRNRI